MNADHIEKMQAARRASLAAKQAEVDRLAGDAAAVFLDRHKQALWDHRARWAAKLVAWVAEAS